MLQARPDRWSGSIRFVLRNRGLVVEALFGGQFVKDILCVTPCPREEVCWPLDFWVSMHHSEKKRRGTLTNFMESWRGGGRLGNVGFDWDDVSCIGSLHSQRATLLMYSRSKGFTWASRKQGILLFLISTRSVRQGTRTVCEEHALITCRTSDVQIARYSPTCLSVQVCTEISNLLPFDNRLGGILRACWRIGSWVESVTRP